MKLTTILSILALLIMAGGIGAQEFYYGTDGTITMLRDSTKILLKFDPSVPAVNQSAILDSIGRIVEVIPSSEPVDEFVVCSLSTSAGYDTFLDSVQTIPGILFTEPFYLLEDSGALFIGQSYCVAFDSSLNTEQIDSINTLYHVTAQRELLGMPNVFLLLNTVTSGYRTLELANLYHGLPETRYAHPNFGMRAVTFNYKLFDYYNNYQPHIKKVIGSFNTASVWDFAGVADTIIVAVIDDGVDSHEDLPVE